MTRRRVVSLAAGGLLALSAVLAIPGIAAAHNPSATLTCVQGVPKLSISLTSYNTGGVNTVSASIDGTSVLSTTDFGASYSNTFSAGSSFVSHTAQVVVYAYDDPTGTHGWTKTFNLSHAACETATPSPTHDPTATATHTSSPTATATHTSSPTTTATASASHCVVDDVYTAPTPCPTAFQSFQGETATPASTPTACPTLALEDPAAVVTASPCATPFQSFQGETATPASTTTPPPTSTDGTGSGTDSSPLFALLISILFGGLGLAAVQAQRAGVRR